MKKSTTYIYDYLPEELEDIVIAEGGKAFRAKQIFSGLYSGKHFDSINIDRELKQRLLQRFNCNPISEKLMRRSVDGTQKFLLQLRDDKLIECVLMRRNYGNTLCISTQVGCRMGCVFCASGKDGLIRNLSAGEIAAQVIYVNSLVQSENSGLKTTRGIKNIVLMGSGEPLDNYDQTVKFLKLVSHKLGLNFSLRNISLSTCGLAPQIKNFADEGLPVTLCFSMHSAFDDRRIQLMPVSKSYPLTQVIDALKYYFKMTGRRIIIEYSMMGGINHFDTDVQQLKRVLNGLNCHINLIKLSAVKDSNIRPCTVSEEQTFLKALTESGLSATIRSQLGADIDGACGQLRNKFVGDLSAK